MLPIWLTALDKRAVVFTSDFTDDVYLSVIGELPNLGADVFMHTRTLYAQLRNINFLRSEAKARRLRVSKTTFLRP